MATASSSSATRKRQRGSLRSGVVFVRSSRPIDKVLPGVDLTDIVAAQQSQDLVTASTACTATGIRWSLNACARTTADAGNAKGAWAIIILRDGDTAQTMSLTGGSNLYEPEQDVLAFGRWQVQLKGDATGTGPTCKFFEGETKTMRKLKIGDKLTLIAIGEAGNEVDLTGTVQVFCRF